MQIVVRIAALATLVGAAAGLMFVARSSKFVPIESERAVRLPKLAAALTASDAQTRVPDAIRLAHGDDTVFKLLAAIRLASGIDIVADVDGAARIPVGLAGVRWPVAIQAIEHAYGLEIERLPGIILLKKSSKRESNPAPFDWIPEHRGEPLKIELSNAQIHDLATLWCEVTGNKIITDSSVEGTLTISAESATANELLVAILRLKDLDAEMSGNTVHVWSPSSPNMNDEYLRIARTTDEGVIDCSFTFRIKDPGDQKATIAHYDAQLSASGDKDDIKFGDRIPVITAAQLGGPPTTTYLEAATRIAYSVRLGHKDKWRAWFHLDGEYARPIETLTGISSKQPAPYIDAFTFITELPIDEATPQKIAGYEDALTGKSIEIELEWHLVRPPIRHVLPVFPTGERLLTITEMTYQVLPNRYWLVISPDYNTHILTAGLRVPVETSSQLGGPSTITYISAMFQMDIEQRERERGDNADVRNFAVRCTNNRILNRPYAPEFSVPYITGTQFSVTTAPRSGQQETISIVDDKSRDLHLQTTFQWTHI
ncbi:MAG: hypothetical protein ACRD3Q_09305 [Terriglobales bacterium]